MSAEKQFTWTGPRDGRFAAAPAVTDAPAGLTARPGRAQVTLDWQAVPGAIGYLVHRADSLEGPFVPLDHHGGDTVMAVPHPPYADTQVEPGRERWYAVAALADVHSTGPCPSRWRRPRRRPGRPLSRSASTRPAQPGRCTGRGVR
jgi:xylan 1,4-beta-xylosidase